jgi:hypothetical protein
VEDSKDKPQAELKPPETSLVIIKTKEGGTREMLRTAGGTFAKKNKPLRPSIDFTRIERKFLGSPNKENPKLSEHEVAFRHVMSIAQGKGSSDPKADMASVKAYEVAMRRALGKEASSEQDLDRLEKQPITAYFVEAPRIMNPDIVDADKIVEKKTQPNFAEVLGVITDEKK